MKFDTQFTDEPICPYCGHEQSDAWEIGNGEGDFTTDCDECEREFRMSRIVFWHYNTSKLPTPAPDDAGKEGE